MIRKYINLNRRQRLDAVMCFVKMGLVLRSRLFCHCHDCIRIGLLRQETDHLRAKAARQAELLEKAERARVEAEEDRARMEARLALSDKGAALLHAARLKLELEVCRDKLAQLERHVRDCMLLLFHEHSVHATSVVLLSRLHVCTPRAEMIKLPCMQVREKGSRSELDNPDHLAAIQSLVRPPVCCVPLAPV